MLQREFSKFSGISLLQSNSWWLLLKHNLAFQQGYLTPVITKGIIYITKIPCQLIRIDTPVSTLYHIKQLMNGVLKDGLLIVVFLKMMLWTLWTKLLNNSSEKVHFKQQRKFLVCIFADKWNLSETRATSKMELFVTLAKCFCPLTIITKNSILDVAGVLNPPLKNCDNNWTSTKTLF